MVDQNIESIRGVMVALLQVSMRGMAKMRRHRNTLATIAKLPEELLAGVLLDAAQHSDGVDESDYYPDNDYPRQISTLCQVSTTWSDIIHSTPQIWSRISTNTSPAFIKAALRHSSTSPLSFEGDIVPGYSERVVATLEVIGELPRWIYAKISAPSNNDLDILTYSAAPRLKKLTLSCKRNDSTPLQLFDGQTPRLEYIDITNVTLEFPSGILTGLTSIALRQTTVSDPQWFFQVLKASPSLKSLLLDDFKFSNVVEDWRTEGRPTVGQEALSILHLIDLPIDSLNCIIRRITPSSPVFQDLFLGLLPLPEVPDSTQLSEILQPIILFTHHLIPQGTDRGLGYTVAAGDSTFIIGSERFPGSSVTMTFKCPKSEAIVQALAEGIMAAIDPCRCAIRLLPSERYQTWRSLNRWQSVQKLLGTKTKGVVNYLSNPIGDPITGKLSWPLPHLTEMQLRRNNYGKAEDVLKMLRSRKGRLHPAMESVAVELPKPLRQLTIARECIMDRVTFLRIKTVMGAEGTVIWESEVEPE